MTTLRTRQVVSIPLICLLTISACAIYKGYPEIAQVVLRLLFLLSVLYVASMELFSHREDKPNIFILVFIAIGLVYPLASTARDLCLPEITERIHRNGPDDFKGPDSDGHYTLEMPHEIEDVFVFYYSRKLANGRIERMNWVKDIDYKYDGHNITSKHELNGAVGNYQIIYKYRVPFYEYPWVYALAKRSLN